MQRLTMLSGNKYRRKYNDVLLKKLEKANIEFTQIGTRSGYLIKVSEAQFSQANTILLSVSHTNPQY